MVAPLSLGLAARPATNALRETDTATTAGNVISRSKPAAQPAPLFEENPLRAIGVVLGNFAAGARGQELPSDRLIQERQIARSQRIDEMKASLLGFEALDTATKVMNRLPDDQRENFAKQFGAQFDAVIPGFSEILLGTQGQQFDLRQFLDVFGDEENLAIVAQLTNGDPDKIGDLMANENFMERMISSTDERNLPVVQSKLATVMGELAGKIPDSFLKDKAVSLGELRQLNGSVIPEELRLSNSELGTLTRNPNILLDHGITTPEIQQEAAMKAAGADKFGPPTRDVNGNLVQKNITTGEIKVLDQATDKFSAPYENENGVLVQKNLRTNKVAEVSRPIVGRTPEDLAEGERKKLEARGEFEADQPVPNAVRRLAGLDEMTVGEFQEKGYSIPRQERLEELQDQEKSTKGGLRIIRSLQTQVEGKPELLSAPGALAKLATDLRGNAIGLAKLAGIEVEASTDPTAYLETFREIGIENAVMQSMVTDLAFALARSREGARLSDKDIQAAIRTIGSSTGNPESFIKVLDSVALRMDETRRDSVQTDIGPRPPSLLFEGMSKEQMEKAAARMSDEEIKRALSGSGAKPTGVPVTTPAVPNLGIRG
jgi:hypothetical protein